LKVSGQGETLLPDTPTMSKLPSRRDFEVYKFPGIDAVLPQGNLQKGGPQSFFQTTIFQVFDCAGMDAVLPHGNLQKRGTQSAPGPPGLQRCATPQTLRP